MEGPYGTDGPLLISSQRENGCFLCRLSFYRRVGKGLKIEKPRSGSVENRGFLPVLLRGGA
jgi:hypothetical protein